VLKVKKKLYFKIKDQRKRIKDKRKKINEKDKRQKEKDKRGALLI
jgi:hypothetical protein